MTLKADILDDLETVFFDANEFAVSATYTELGEDAATITVIHDPEELAIDPETGEVLNRVSIAEAITTDVANAAHKDTLVINSVTYTILTAAPSRGTTILTLHKN